MIRSMTGFGRGKTQTDDIVVRAEVRSVNNRALRISCRVPERLQGIEPELEKSLRHRIARGSVVLSLALDDLSGNSGPLLDKQVIAHYRDQLLELRDSLGLAGEVTIDNLMALPGVVRKNITGGEVPAELVRLAHEATAAAMDELITNREREGEHIWNDIIARCDTITALVDRIEQRLPKMTEQFRKNLMERLRTVMEQSGGTLNEQDVSREVVIFADRSDISEEITRMRTHIALAGELDAGDGPSGRRLEFIAQEMFREANTMASKAGGAELIPELLDVKSEVEKIREQALNVE